MSVDWVNESPGGEGDTSRKTGWVCETLSLLQTKIFDFPFPILDLK